MVRILRVFLLAFGLASLLLGGFSAFAVEKIAPTVRYVTPDGSDPSNDCTHSTTACASLQHAVDVAAAGDEVRVAAGRYAGVRVRHGLTQTVFISQSLTLRGGYTTTNWTESDPKANPTILDAQGLGRVMTIRGPISVTVDGLEITGGDARGLGGEEGTQFFRIDRGGGLYVLTATLTLRNSRIYSNTAYEGGGLSLQGSENSRLTSNDVFSNTARGETGGILIEASHNISVTNNVIQYNRLQRLPPAEWIVDPYVFDCGAGGMLVIGSNDVVINDTTVADNEGVGLCLYGGSVVVTHSTISNNRGRGISSVFGQTVIRYSVVSGNGETGKAGGIGGLQTEIVLEKNRITNNRAGVGGGLYFSSSNVTLSRNWIVHNQAHLGGGIYLWLFNPSQKITVVNTVIADNESDGPGGGIYMDDANIEIVHSTIARNRGGDGSGVYLKAHVSFGAAVSMTNTILTGHQVGISGTQSSSASLNGVLWNSTDANVLGPVTLTSANIYTSSAGFACDGYHLAAGSAAIDKGVMTDVKVDIDGESRPQGTAPDLGADEFVTDTLISCMQSYLPLVVR